MLKDQYYIDQTLLHCIPNDFFDPKFQETLELGKKWYILSTTWLQKLENYLKFPENNENFSSVGKIDNSDIIDSKESNIFPKNFPLKESCSFIKDYKIIPASLWKFLKKKFGYLSKISRKVIKKPDSKKELEINPLKLKILILKNSKIINTEPLFFFFSKTVKIPEILTNLKNFTSKDFRNISSARLWKAGSQVSLDLILKLLEKNEVFIDFPGVRIESFSGTLNDLGVKIEDFFIYEYKEGYSSKFILREKKPEICTICSSSTNDGHLCTCHQFYFCSETCSKTHKPSVPSKSIPTQLTSNFFFLSKGLKNLGNTCYLNAGLQCLFHTSPLIEYILHDSYLEDLNLVNPLSTKGRLICEFADLVHQLSRKTSNISPGPLKEALSEFSSQFSSNMQQDCQEMLSYLLDGLHEDVNKVIDKPITETPDDQGKNDEELKEINWKNHLLRNDSFLVKIMHGQLKSALRCPDCSQFSRLFDPFLMISLPVPDNSLKIVYFVLVTHQSSLMGKVQIGKKALVCDLRAEISKTLKIPENSFEIVEFFNNFFVKFLQNDKKVKKRSTVLIFFRDSQKSDFFDEDFKYIVLTFKKKTADGGLVKLGKPHLILTDFCSSLRELYSQVLEYTLKMRNIHFSNLSSEFSKRLPSHSKKSYLDIDEFKLIFDEHLNKPCPQCFQVTCTGCLIRCSNDLVAGLFLSTTEEFLRVSVVLSSKLQDFSPFENLSFHPSCDEKVENSENFTLNECFRLFSSVEQLDDSNSLFCKTCKKHSNFLKTLEIVRLPEILIIHLKRFKRKGNKSVKNQAMVDFPVNSLDLGQICEVPGVYSLYAVVQHMGSLEGGHYNAVCKGLDEKWRLFDDDIVRPITFKVTPAAYILFYRKINS